MAEEAAGSFTNGCIALLVIVALTFIFLIIYHFAMRKVRFQANDQLRMTCLSTNSFLYDSGIVDVPSQHRPRPVGRALGMVSIVSGVS